MRATDVSIDARVVDASRGACAAMRAM